MKYIVTDPQQDRLTCSLFESGQRKPLYSDTVELSTTDCTLEQFLKQPTPSSTFQAQEQQKYPVAIRIRYGGDQFDGPTVIDDHQLDILRDMSSEAPMHLPIVIDLIKSVRENDHFGSVVLVFDTAFFTNLPAREQSYGLPPELADELNIRRYGFNGLYHEMACQEIRSSAPQMTDNSRSRIISICLEPKPEVCSVLGQRPLTVTGGPTPLEGIPGERSCGEIDPSIVLELSEKENWGPEKINQILTRDSGMKGLTERSVNLDSILTDQSNGTTLARDILFYRIQLACGAGITALGGLDGIVFSGRYADASKSLRSHLRQYLLPALRNPEDITFLSCDISIERIVADIANPMFHTFH